MFSLNLTHPNASANAAFAAYLLHDKLWAGKPSVVDTVWLANQLGLSVVEVRLPRGVAAALVKDEGHDALILLKRGLAKPQLRYQCALQLGRYAYYTEVGPATYADYAPVEAPDPLSQLAKSFADELTMPRACVIELQSDRIPVSLMARRFDVDVEDMQQRLSRLA